MAAAGYCTHFNADVAEYVKENCKESCNLCIYCFTTLCAEGEGDCEFDSQCEGSLVCGHMNCVNSTLQNCCTHPCNNDSDCITSGECDAENSLCRLNSDSIDWSRCGPGSQCADGEGDCDDDSECNETLLCGNDNCGSGPIEMDCCFRLCHNDSDCLNQECNTDTNQCRLDSYSTNWSYCSEYSLCHQEEGDCDQHVECEGELLCGVDNCPFGPTYLDCCTGSSIVRYM